MKITPMVRKMAQDRQYCEAVFAYIMAQDQMDTTLRVIRKIEIEDREARNQNRYSKSVSLVKPARAAT